MKVCGNANVCVEHDTGKGLASSQETRGKQDYFLRGESSTFTLSTRNTGKPAERRESSGMRIIEFPHLNLNVILQIQM